MTELTINKLKLKGEIVGISSDNKEGFIRIISKPEYISIEVPNLMEFTLGEKVFIEGDFSICQISSEEQVN